MKTSKILGSVIAFLFVASTILSLVYADHTIDLTSEWTANGDDSLSVDQGEDAELLVYVTSTENIGLWIEVFRGSTVVRTIFADSTVAADSDDPYVQEFTIDTEDLAGDYVVRVHAMNTEGDEVQLLNLNVDTIPAVSVMPDNYDVNEGETLWIPRIVTVDQDGDEVEVALFQQYCISTGFGSACWNLPLIDNDVEVTREGGIITSITYTPEYDEVQHPNQERILTLVLRAFDGENYSPDEHVTIRVHDVNRIPAITSTPITEAVEGSLYSYRVIAADADPEDDLTYTLTTYSIGMTIDKAHRLRWTPDYNDAGDHDVTVRVSDGIDSVEQEFTITVENTNRAPVLVPIGDRSVAENELLAFTITGSDPDGDAVSFSASGLPAGATFDAATQTFSWIPAFDQTGSYEVTFRITDGSLADGETITISVGDVNRPPVLAPIGDQTATEGETLMFIVTAADPDGDRLSFEIEGFDVDDLGALFIDNGDGTATFKWTPTFDQTGSYEVRFQVTDGSLLDEETITISVGDVNQPPVLAPIGDQTAIEGETLEFTITATDLDGNALTFTIEDLNLADIGATFIDNGDGTATFSWTPGLAQSGVYEATFIVSDGALDDLESIFIAVEDLPVVEVPGCTDATATNYNPAATTDDGSCEYEEPCPDLNNNGVCDRDEEPPCPDVNGNGICDDEEVPPCPDANGNGICDTEEVPGCTDPAATNFNPDADVNDGSCQYDEPCVDLNNNGVCDTDEEILCPDLNNNGVCDRDEEPPCPDVNGNGICDDDEVPPCPDTNSNGICDEDELPVDVLGCTDPTALNYNSRATLNVGNCRYAAGPSTEIRFTSVHLSTEEVVAGDTLLLQVGVRNEGDEDLDDLQIGVMVYDLNVYRPSATFDLRDGRSTSKLLAVEVPYDAVPGDYLLKVSVGNSRSRTSTYRIITVI